MKTQITSGSRPISTFLSYSREDTAKAEAVSQALKEKGLRVLLDSSHILFAEKWRARIDSLIESSDAFVFLASPASSQSAECQRELEYAADLKKKIVPIALQKPTGSWLPAAVRDLHLIELSYPLKFGH